MELTMKVSREALERFWHSWSPTGLALATWVTLSTIFAFLPLWASASLSVKWNPDIKWPWRFLPLWDLVLVLHYLYPGNLWITSIQKTYAYEKGTFLDPAADLLDHGDMEEARLTSPRQRSRTPQMDRHSSTALLLPSVWIVNLQPWGIKTAWQKQYGRKITWKLISAA